MHTPDLTFAAPGLMGPVLGTGTQRATAVNQCDSLKWLCRKEKKKCDSAVILSHGKQSHYRARYFSQHSPVCPRVRNTFASTNLKSHTPKSFVFVCVTERKKKGAIRMVHMENSVAYTV